MDIAPEKITGYFKVGGTLHLNTPSYVKRPADDELLKHVLAGQFCYVLTPRQMGKSSLMLRTATHLRQQGTRTAIVDLSSIGTQVTIEEWYLGLIKRLGLELDLSVEPEQWWQQRSVPPVQRFTEFLHDIVLAEIKTQIVIFIDEIDSTLRLSFADDFFAAIRFIYNLRASQPEYERLTFVLLGVAAPTDLIQDRSRTPFNIGQAIGLHEFSREDAQPLCQGLELVYPGQGQRVLDRIFFWTNGHPYLTQKLCVALIEASTGEWSDQQIDALVEKLFLTEEAKKEDNLQFVRRNIELNPERHRLMQLYRRVYSGEVVKEDEHSYLQNRLRLIGLVRVEDRILQVRNEIYRRVFNRKWIEQNIPVNWTQRITIGALIISILVSLIGYFFMQWQQQQELETKVQTYIDRFHRTKDADIRLNSLAGLCDLDKDKEAQDMFFVLPAPEQLDIFDKVKVEEAGPKLVTVVGCLHPGIVISIENVQHSQTLETKMCCALDQLDAGAREQFVRQLGHPCECTTEIEDGSE